MTTLTSMITKAKMLGATVNVTHYRDDELATVQVLGLRNMTEFPLPANQAAKELRHALREKGAV